MPLGYKSMMWLHVEYFMQFWLFYLKKGISKTGNYVENGKHMIKGLKHLSKKERLKRFVVFSSEKKDD